LGKAKELLIYGKENGRIVYIETRETPAPGSGLKRWEELANLIGDCRALLVAGVGDNPRSVLSKKGIDILELDGLIEEAVEAVFEGYSINYMMRRDIEACNRPCSGSMGGMGCI
jgi:nitrogen fixation protein NifB